MKTILKLLLFTSLLVITKNGQVSIIKDLDDRTCKIIECKLKSEMYCNQGAFCDIEHNLILPKPRIDNCIGYSLSDAWPVRVDCLK